MAISAEHVGRTYHLPHPYEVSRAKIEEFARALGDPHPAYLGDDPIAPPTFGAVIAAQAWEPVFADPDLGIQLAGTVHADQRFDITRPLRPGDHVHATSTITKVRVRGTTAFVTIEVTFTVDGQQVGTATSQMLCSLRDSREEGEQA